MVETAGPAPDQGERLQILDRDECERLLTQESVGRVAVVLDGRPMIRIRAQMVAGRRIERYGAGS